MSSTRTVAINRQAATSVNPDDSLDWETSVDAPGAGTMFTYCVVGDSSGNVYITTNNSLGGFAELYKFNSSGVKQWKTNTGIALDTPRLVTIASDGYIWVSLVKGAGTGEIVRVSTAGVAVTVVTSTADFQGNLESDGAGGVWVGAISLTPTYEIRRYDSTGSLLTTITDADLNHGATLVADPCFAVDSSNNIYGLTKASASPWKVKKWDSSGALQWTSGDIGWASSGSIPPRAIAVDGSYIFVGGAFVA